MVNQHVAEHPAFGVADEGSGILRVFLTERHWGSEPILSSIAHTGSASRRKQGALGGAWLDRERPLSGSGFQDAVNRVRDQAVALGSSEQPGVVR
jgi:hypothetical protein